MNPCTYLGKCAVLFFSTMRNALFFSPISFVFPLTEHIFSSFFCSEQTLFTTGYPWAYCQGEWNTPSCNEKDIFHVTSSKKSNSSAEEIPLFSFWDDPIEQCHESTYSIAASGVAALAFAWILTALPQIRGLSDLSRFSLTWYIPSPIFSISFCSCWP